LAKFGWRAKDYFLGIVIGRNGSFSSGLKAVDEINLRSIHREMNHYLIKPTYLPFQFVLILAADGERISLAGIG
jgi:hypothetical protein